MMGEKQLPTKSVDNSTYNIDSAVNLNGIYRLREI